MLETDIHDGLVDLHCGPVAKDYVDPALVITQLFKNGRIIAGRPGHPLRDATTLKQLAGASWVTAPVAVDCDNEVNTSFETAGLPPPHIAMQAA